MRFRTTLVFALILALLGAYVYFFEYKKGEETKKKEEEEKKVFRIDWEKMKGLKLVNTNGTFVIERSKTKKGETEEEEWRIKDPIDTEGEGSTLNGLVSTLKNLKIEQVVAEEPKNLVTFGLGAPKLKVGVLLTEGTPPPLLLVGDKSPVGLNSYAMVEGEKKVLLLSSDLGTQFDKKLFDLRDKRIFQFKRDDVEKLRIEKKGGLFLEVMKKEDKWEILSPLKARASESELNKILNKLVGLRAEAFEDEATQKLSYFGLDKPGWKIEVTMIPDHTVASLFLGKDYKKDTTDFVYAKRGERPVVVALKGDILSTIDKKAEDLREKKVFPFKSWEVHKLDLVLEGGPVTLAKDEAGKWQITSPIAARADGNKITSLLSSLSQLEAVDFLTLPSSQGELATYGLEAPKAMLTLYEKEGKKIGTLRLGAGEAGKEAYFALAEEGDTIYKIKPDLVRNLPTNMDEIREKKLLDFPRYQVARIEANDAGKGLVLERKGGIWKLTKPDSRNIEEKDANDLLSLVSDLQAERFISEESKDLSTYGLSQPGIIITLKNDKGEVMGTLLISSKGPEGDTKACYAKEAKDAWIGLIQVDTRKKIQDRLASFYSRP